jgi:CrcB protein
VGVLGGYTTFSSFAMEVEQLLASHQVITGLLYLVATVTLCGAAVWVSTTLTRRIGRRPIGARPGRGR